MTLSAYDVDDDALSFAIASPPANGAITGDDGDNLVTYTPDSGFTGQDSFTFVAGDGVAESNAATVTITVTDELVVIVSVSTGRPYSLATAQTDALYYIDRNYRISSLESELDGMVMVRTSNNDKYVAEPDHLVLRLGVEAVVSVCYDKRWSVLPSWLEDGTWRQYVLKRQNPAEWRAKIQVSGTRKDLDQLKGGAVQAYNLLTDDDKKPIESWLTRQVVVHLPRELNLSLLGTRPSVSFKLEKAPAAATP